MKETFLSLVSKRGKWRSISPPPSSPFWHIITTRAIEDWPRNTVVEFPPLLSPTNFTWLPSSSSSLLAINSPSGVSPPPSEERGEGRNWVLEYISSLRIQSQGRTTRHRKRRQPSIRAGRGDGKASGRIGLQPGGEHLPLQQRGRRIYGRPRLCSAGWTSRQYRVVGDREDNIHTCAEYTGGSEHGPQEIICVEIIESHKLLSKFFALAWEESLLHGSHSIQAQNRAFWHFSNEKTFDTSKNHEILEKSFIFEGWKTILILVSFQI